MFNIRSKVTFSLLLLHITIALANKPYVANIFRKNYGANNKNWSINEDERGILYFGNDAGLLQYDGIEWSLDEMPNSPIIRSIGVKSHNTIFTGGYEEFGRWDRDISDKLVYTSLSGNLDKSIFQNDDFWKIWVDSSVVYFQSFNSIYVYDYKTVRRIASDKGFLFLSKVRNEYLVQQMRGPLFRLKGMQLEKIENSDFLKNADVRVTLPFGRKEILVGTARQGLYIYDGISFKEWNSELSKEINEKELSSAILTSSNTYMIGTILGGIYEVNTNGNIINRFSAYNGLQNNTILSLFEDRRHSIWVAMDRGLAHIEYIKDTDCYIDTDGNTPSVYDAQIWQNKLFLATNQGVFYLHTKDFSSPFIFDKLRLIEGSQGQAWRLKKIGDNLYSGHNKGLLKINKDLSFQKIQNIDIGVYDINELNIYNEKITILSTYHSITIIHPENGNIYKSIKIKEPIITSTSDHLDNIWLEHFNKGVYRCRLNKSLTEIDSYKYFGGDSGDGLPYKLKIFKVGGRVMFYGDNTFYIYDDIKDIIIPSSILNECFKFIDGIKNIIPVGKSDFWALGKAIICRFRFDGYKAELLESIPFNDNISLVNNYENASLVDQNKMIVCLDNGFLIHHKPTLEQKKRSSVELKYPLLTSVEASSFNGKKQYYATNSKAKISNNLNNFINFKFSSADIFMPNISFQYKLEGIDLDWIEENKKNQVSYERVPTGKYTFKLRTKDNVGNISKQIEYNFQILPPWYNSILAYVLYLTLFILCLYLLWILVLRRYRNLHLQLIRAHETKRLKILTNELQGKLEIKNAELLTQTSFIIQKNELILKTQSIIDEFRKTPFNKELNAMIKKIDSLLITVDTENDWKTFLIAFEEKHEDFFKKLKKSYPQLTANDLRLCACLKLNLESKEIASLMNLSVRAVENSRYRLRKKLELIPSQNLNEFILSI